MQQHNTVIQPVRRMVSGWPSKFTTGANCTMGGTWNYFWELNIEFGKKNQD